MLELLFRGFFEWVYGLIVDIWGFIAGGLLDIMGLDFAYLQSHIPIMGDMARALMAVGWALLLGNLVFQALKSMAAGLGFEGEDPRLLFARTFVFAFLLLASPQICRLGLALTAPLAFAMGGSKNTASIFTGWCRMFGSMCLLMVTNLVCFKMLFSVVSTVPSGLDVLPWMVLIFAIVKVAHKSDAIITRIGLNPAITGGGRSLLGTLANTVVRTVVSQATKGVMGGLGGGRYSSHSTTSQQTSTRQESASRSSTQQTSSGGSTFQGNRTHHGGGRYSSTRRSSVPPGSRRSPSYVPPNGSAQPSNQTAPQGQPGTSASKQPNGSRPVTAGSTVPRGGAFSASTPRPGQAGTSSTGRQTASQPTTNGRPGGSFAGSRTTRRENSGAVPKTPTTPTPGASQSGGAGRPSRSTQRPADSAPRPGRNIPPVTAALPSGGTPSSPTAQETRKSTAPTSPSMKGGAPTVRSGSAGTASAAQQERREQPWIITNRKTV